MGRKRDGESGQTVVEFALVATVLFMLTLGLVDVGRAFFQYNEIAAAARYGARWGGVVGGTCLGAPESATFDTSWCTQELTKTTNFWAQNGNAPTQATNYVCPDAGGPVACCPNSGTVAGFTYYLVSNFTGSNQSTIVGAIASKFDTSSSSDNFIAGGLTPGINLSNLKVCIQLPVIAGAAVYKPGAGDKVTVKVYSTFQPAGPLFGNATLPLVASSTYTIE
jgi:Flp pilus assembly protein TadG